MGEILTGGVGENPVSYVEVLRNLGFQKQMKQKETRADPASWVEEASRLLENNVP